MSDDKIIPGLPAGNLADVLGKVVDHFAGPQRVRERATAYADAAVTAAKAENKIAQLRAESQARLDDVELRRQRNINAIAENARASLPAPQAKETQDSFSEDFAYRFFADCADIGDPELQILWGKLLADEVNHPGSYHPSTLSILKNMTKDDTALLEKLCQMIFVFGPNYYERVPIFLDQEEQHRHLRSEINFDNLSHLEALGILHHNPLGGYQQDQLGTDTVVRHFDRFAKIRFATPNNTLTTGGVLFSRAGSELSRLASVMPLPGLFEAATELWRREALSVEEVEDEVQDDSGER